VAVEDDTIWVGTFGGLYAVRGAELRQVDLPGSPAAPLITSLMSEGRALWVGTWGQGILRLQGTTWSSWRELPRFVNTLRGTPDGVLACTTEGLVAMGPTTNPHPSGGGSPGSPGTPR
jgi:ligand-binding sensor domain-containing protein